MPKYCILFGYIQSNFAQERWQKITKLCIVNGKMNNTYLSSNANNNNKNSKAFFRGYFTKFEETFTKYEKFLHVRESKLGRSNTE